MKLFKKKYILYCIIIASIYLNIYYFKINISEKIISYVKLPEKTYNTIFGDIKVKEDILLDALENDALKRMAYIDQGGPLVYFNFSLPFSRYDHCLGVWALIRRFNGSTEEQLAGLYHDISHTAFSHVADVLFQKNHKDAEHSYQDNIHLWFIENSSANLLCQKYNLNIQSLNPDLPCYTMLEAPLPDMCADRIEYNLHTAYIYNLLSKEDIERILSHLHFDVISYYKGETLVNDKVWFFDDIVAAKQFAILPLHFTTTLWNAPYNMIFYKFFSHMIEYAFNKGYITKDAFHFNTDQKILSILYNNKDPYIIYMLDMLSHIFTAFDIVKDNNTYDEILSGKFRGIDPLVLFNGSNHAQRLTDLDFNFNYFYNTVKAECLKGNKIKYNNIYSSKDFYQQLH